MNYKNIVYNMNYKNIVWFIKAIYYMYCKHSPLLYLFNNLL